MPATALISDKALSPVLNLMKCLNSIKFIASLFESQMVFCGYNAGFAVGLIGMVSLEL